MAADNVCTALAIFYEQWFYRCDVLRMWWR